MWRMCVNIVIFTSAITAVSQQEKAVHWLTFEQLSDSIKNNQKKYSSIFMPIGVHLV